MDNDEGVDFDHAIEVLWEVIREQGKVVFVKEWDSGGPGAGAGEELVYLFKGLHWPDTSTFGFRGPYASLEESLQGDVGAITSATVRIRCTEVAPKALAKLLWIQSSPKMSITINDQRWSVSRSKLVAC